jgi:hypothetical protein
LTAISCKQPQSGDLSPWNARLGEFVVLRVLAYAIDDHAQAALTIVENDAALSKNAFTHISVSVQNSGPYSPVYSNTLWQRAAAAAPLGITRDAAGQISAVALPGGATTWSGVLPATFAPNGTVVFPPSAARVMLLADKAPTLDFLATVCLASHWNATASGTCSV